MSTFEEGFRNFTRMAGANNAAIGGAGYVKNVENAIGELEYFINVELRFNKDGSINQTKVLQLKGDAAEYWHGGTHNIDAAVKGAATRVDIQRSHVVGSPDIVGNWEDSRFGLKYYKHGGGRDANGNPVSNRENAAYQQSEIYRAKYEAYQSKLIKDGEQPLSYEGYFQKEYEKYLAECAEANRMPKDINDVFPGYSDPNNPLYLGQHRIIAKEQLEEAQAWLRRRILEESNSPRASEQVKRYQETLDKLTDRIKSNEGSESIPLSKEEAEELARLAREGDFDPAEWGLTTHDLIKWQHIMTQARKAGLSAAVITVVLEVAPALLRIFTKLIRDGEIDTDNFKQVGFSAVRGVTLGYIRGTIAAAITIASKAGKLGVAMQGASPTVIGAVVALTMNTIQNAVMMSFGSMTHYEFANRCIQDLFVTSCSLALGVAMGSALSAAFPLLLPKMATLGYMLGSFIGGVMGSFVYKTGYSCMMSFCVNTGCTFFGLVKQDYALPEEVMKELGMEVFEYENFALNNFESEAFATEQFQYDQFNFDEIDIRIIRRGIIGVNIVGFV